MLQVDNCHSYLYTTVGSNVHHSTSLRRRDAPIPRRLVDSSRILDHWYSGEGQAPASVCGAGITSHCRKSSLILSQDMTFLDMQIQSVWFIAKPTATGVGNKNQDHRGVSFIPGPTSCSLASSSGPPFYLLIKAPRYGRYDRRLFCCLSAFINGSLCHMCLSPCTIMNTWAYIGEVPTKACLVQSGRSSETAPLP